MGRVVGLTSYRFVCCFIPEEGPPSGGPSRVWCKCHQGVTGRRDVVPTHFLQTTGVNRAGELIGERWGTIGAYNSEEFARSVARSMAVTAGCVIVDAKVRVKRANGGPYANGVRVVALKDLLEEGPDAVYYAILDLTNEDAEYVISTHLGYEAA
jgi:hypothetical protein